MLLLFIACHSADIALPAASEPPSERLPDGTESAVLFETTRIHEVQIQLSDADWDELRLQTRTYWDIFGESCLQEPYESPYSYFEGQVSFDGEALGTVGVRKKGFLGSLSEDRPSFKIKVDEYTQDATFHGLERLVLNNNNQDRGRLRSCTAHQLFADAGLVAPRCSLAHVTVNGVDLGIYSHVENIDPELVGRQLGALPTSMYEGTLSDFREGWTVSFETELDGSTGQDILAVQTALEGDDAGLLERLDAVIDLDQFYVFWAAESLAGHWDGYNGDTNNFFVYGAPEDGRLRFIASGPDAAFDSSYPFGRQSPIWITTTSALANRLARHPEGLEQYRAALTILLDQVWQGEQRLNTYDQWVDLLESYNTSTMRTGQAETRSVLAARESDVRAKMDEAIEVPDLRGNICWVERGTAQLDFSTTWNSYPGGDVYAGGTVSGSYTFDGVTYTPIANGASVGYEGDLALSLVISTIAENVYFAPYVIFDPALVRAGSVLQLDGREAQGSLLYKEGNMQNFTTAAYLSSGTLTIDEGALVNGATVSGHLDVTLSTNGF